MAVSENNLITLNDVINKIDNELKKQMQDRIVWYRGNLPPYFPSDAGWTNRFEASKTLTKVSGSGWSGTVMSFRRVYDALIQAFALWSQVRVVTYRYTYRHDDNGSVWYDDYTYRNIGRISSGEVNIQNNIKNLVNHKDQVMTVARMNSFIATLYNKWNQLISTYAVSWQYDACHSSCHSSCHKSGGRR